LVNRASQENLRRNRFKSRIDRNMKSMPLKNAKLGFSAAPVHRRNRLLTFSALPAVCFIWLFGWSLYWIGTHRERLKVTRKPEKSTTTFVVLLPEQNLEATETKN